jgi:hypothetical protein
VITGNALCFFNKPNFNLPNGQPEAVNQNTDKIIAKKNKKTHNDLPNITRKLNIKQLEHKLVCNIYFIIYSLVKSDVYNNFNGS